MNYHRVLVNSLLAVSLLWGGHLWAAAGDPLWEQTFDYLPDYDQTQIFCLAASSGILLVSGSALKQTINIEPPIQSVVSLGFIRAYDLVTGKLKWQGTPLTLASTQGAVNQNSFANIIVNGNIAMVQGVANSATYNSQEPRQILNLCKSILRAYNINSGQLLWENIQDGVGYNMMGSNIITLSNRVFTAGNDKPAGFLPRSAWVRAHEVPGTYIQALSLLLDEKK